MRFLAYWGILAAETSNANIKKDCPEDDVHLLVQDATICFAKDIVLQYTLQQGRPPRHPSLYNVKAEPHMDVRVPSTEILIKAKFNCRMSWTTTSKG